MTKEKLDAIRERLDAATHLGLDNETMLVNDLRALLDEVERLTADPLPAAAWVREVERAAFARGAWAMREAAVAASLHVAQGCRAALARPSESMTAIGADECATRIRALPIPEDKS
jgi:hypothetical protein